MDKAQLRQQFRKRRQALTHEQINAASEKLFQNILHLSEFQQAKHIAVYSAHDNEINPSLIIEEVFRKNKHCYLPIINPDGSNTLLFSHYQQDTPLTKNKYGINRPVYDPTTIFNTNELDLVLLPLVAFDKQCHRIGFGGGYYDKTFSFKHHDAFSKPTLFGLAFDLQRVEKINEDTWDIPLRGIITEEKIYKRGKNQ